MKKRRVHISEHAMFRYLQRVKGVDMDALRDEIHEQIAIVDRFDGMLPCGVKVGGFRYVIADRTVVTVEPTSREER